MTIDPNLWEQLAGQYSGGVTMPVYGQAGYSAVANAAANNIEYIPPVTPVPTAGQAGYYARVTQAETALEYVFSAGVGGDVGDADATLVYGTDAPTQRWATPLTAPRAATLSTSNAIAGDRFRIVRTATATGASALVVGGTKSLAVGEWCDFEFDGAAWELAAGGSL